jgi:cob(I)alamin adenosyltransferase
MKIYTKQGDKGYTSLVDGTKVKKSNIRLDTYGTVDELNAHLGLLICQLENIESLKKERTELKQVQIWLFQLGSQLACADVELAKNLPTITVNEIKQMEESIDQMTLELPKLKNFILPGGHIASAQSHICRTVCRRAERNCAILSEQIDFNYPAIAFLNRLSDYFFTFSRLINHRLNILNVEWIP